MSRFIIAVLLLATSSVITHPSQATASESMSESTAALTYTVHSEPDVEGNLPPREAVHIQKTAQGDGGRVAASGGSTFTLSAPWPLQVPGRGWGGGTLCNVDEDPDLELVQGIGSNQDPFVYAWNPDGSLVPGWPQAVDPTYVRQATPFATATSTVTGSPSWSARRSMAWGTGDCCTFGTWTALSKPGFRSSCWAAPAVG